jgi:hypothetical protein
MSNENFIKVSMKKDEKDYEIVTLIEGTPDMLRAAIYFGMKKTSY